MKRLQSLDVVRGIAILLVLIWHYTPRTDLTPKLILQITTVFWSGVDLFFVLSGFLIGSIVLRNIKAKNFYKTFYIRRSARILPLYFMLICVFGVALFFHPKVIINTLLNHFPIWSYFTFTQNFFAAAKATFGGKWMGITWSLAVEEQFYIFLSIIARKLNKLNLSYLAIFFVILAPILRFLAPNNIAAYVLPLHRADTLMLGVLIALIWQWDAGKNFLFRNTVIFRWSFVGFFLGVIVLSLKDIALGDPLGHTWLALCYANLIILALTADLTKWSIFGNKILAWIGFRSYGIYLTHRPLRIVSPYVTRWLLGPHQPIWIVSAVAVAITFFVAEILYHLLERPFIALGHRYKYEHAVSSKVSI